MFPIDKAYIILHEFVTDIETAYPNELIDDFKREWPDLFITYQKARKFLNR